MLWGLGEIVPWVRDNMLGWSDLAILPQDIGCLIYTIVLV